MGEKAREIRLLKTLKDIQNAKGAWQTPEAKAVFHRKVMASVASQRVQPVVCEPPALFSDVVCRLVPITSVAVVCLAVVLGLFLYLSDCSMSPEALGTPEYYAYLGSYVF